MYNNKKDYEKALDLLADLSLLNDGAIIICETNVDFCNEDENVYNLTYRKKYRYGNSKRSEYSSHRSAKRSTVAVVP